MRQSGIRAIHSEVKAVHAIVMTSSPFSGDLTEAHPVIVTPWRRHPLASTRSGAHVWVSPIYARRGHGPRSPHASTALPRRSTNAAPTRRRQEPGRHPSGVSRAARDQCQGPRRLALGRAVNRNLRTPLDLGIDNRPLVYVSVAYS